MAISKQKGTKQRPLTIKEKAFCREYAKTGNGTQAVYKAGYDCKNDNSASTRANQLLKKVNVQAEITRIMDKKEKKAIMDANEVMELLTAIARGEVKDQFGLDASLNDRLKAVDQIAKRTVDIENRLKGVPDNQISIKVDWSRD